MIQFYSHTLIQLLIDPSEFFRSLPENISPARVWVFLGGSAIFFAGASLLTGVSQSHMLVMALIYMVNAVGMVCLGAATGYTAMVMICGKRSSFFGVFGLYVFTSGITWLISWVPMLLWFTEPWRWWLLTKGFNLMCGLSRKQAIGVVLVSVPVQWCLVWSAMQALI